VINVNWEIKGRRDLKDAKGTRKLNMNEDYKKMSEVYNDGRKGVKQKALPWV